MRPRAHLAGGAPGQQDDIRGAPDGQAADGARLCGVRSAAIRRTVHLFTVHLFPYPASLSGGLQGRDNIAQGQTASRSRAATPWVSPPPRHQPPSQQTPKAQTAQMSNVKASPPCPVHPQQAGIAGVVTRGPRHPLPSPAEAAAGCPPRASANWETLRRGPQSARQEQGQAPCVLNCPTEPQHSEGEGFRQPVAKRSDSLILQSLPCLLAGLLAPFDVGNALAGNALQLVQVVPAWRGAPAPSALSVRPASSRRP